jgi:hypothetical protein
MQLTRYHHVLVVTLQYVAVLNKLCVSLRHVLLHGVKIFRGSDSSNHILTLNKKQVASCKFVE